MAMVMAMRASALGLALVLGVAARPQPAASLPAFARAAADFNCTHSFEVCPSAARARVLPVAVAVPGSG